MNKVAVVYWSGTGNTQAMAEAVASAAGAELFTADAFSGEKMDAYDAVGFGCPSMGSEQLEESEFEPMFEDCKSRLNGKKIALFGESRSEEAAARHGLDLLAEMPIDPKLASLVDAGKIEDFEGDWMSGVADAVEKLPNKVFEQ